MSEPKPNGDANATPFMDRRRQLTSDAEAHLSQCEQEMAAWLKERGLVLKAYPYISRGLTLAAVRLEIES